MPNENTQTNHKDQADGKFDKNVVNREPLTKGNSDDDEKSGSVYSKNLMSDADTEVRENEDASLQDDTYSFDEDNTDNEEFHDMDDLGEDAGDLTDIFESDDDLQ
jgi:hypothetical protein